MDLRFLRESVSQLQDYLLSNELYWPLSGSLPRLTPGSLLLELKRVQTAGLAPAELPGLQRQVEAIRAKWRTAWEKKAAREVTNRTRLWSQFLSDFAHDPEKNLDSYRSEARGRAILQLLLAEQPDSPEKSAIVDLDILLKSRVKPGRFLWEPELQSVFPQTDFWFFFPSSYVLP